MAFNKILISIALVGLGVSIIKAVEEDTDYTDPHPFVSAPDYVDDLFNSSKMVGKWYVLAATGYKDPRPRPKCWTIDLQQEKPELFSGVSNFIEKSTDSWVSLDFNASFIRKQGNFNVFSIASEFNEKPLSLHVMYFPLTRGDYVSLVIHDYQDPKYSGLRIIMSRQKKLDGEYLGKPAQLVDNTNCPTGPDVISIQ